MFIIYILSAGAMTLPSRRYKATRAISMQWTASCGILQGSKVARRTSEKINPWVRGKAQPTYLMVWASSLAAFTNHSALA